jgi:CheY-like chemotaxis protein
MDLHAPVPRQVLLVDDDADIREVTSMALIDAGYAVVEASGGREALARLATGSCRPVTILLDMSMPGMDGPEFLAELRKLPAFAAVAVILTSAQEDLREAAAVLGVAGYLRKPIGVDELIDMVAMHDHRN